MITVCVMWVRDEINGLLMSEICVVLSAPVVAVICIWMCSVVPSWTLIIDKLIANAMSQYACVSAAPHPSSDEAFRTADGVHGSFRRCVSEWGNKEGISSTEEGIASTVPCLWPHRLETFQGTFHLQGC